MISHLLLVTAFSVAQITGTAIIAGSAFGPSALSCRDSLKLTEDDILKLPQHKFAEYENCLYYKLLDRNRKTQPNNVNNLYLEPPDVDEKIPVNVDNITVFSMYLKWKDERLTWDSALSGLKQIRLQAIGHIWIPDFAGKNRGVSIVSPEFIEFKNIVVRRSGQVTAQVNFNLQSFCEVDQDNFPYDTYNCKFGMKSTIFDDVIEFKLPTRNVKLHPGYKTRAWQAPEASADVHQSDEDGRQVVEVQVRLRREAGILKTLLFVPMAVCGTLFVFSPLVGNLLHQLYFKLFLLGPMELYSLQFLSAKTSHYLQMTPIPRIYIFYEYTLIITLVSTIVTILMLALFRAKEGPVPPPSKLKSFGRIISKITSANDPEKEIATDTKNYSHEWKQVAEGVHFVAMVIIILIYLIGIAAIYA